MLVLSRQRDETIMIGDDIEITVVDIRGDKVRLGISAPTRIAVHRKEVYDAIKAENERAAQIGGGDIAAIRPGHVAGAQGINAASVAGPMRPRLARVSALAGNGSPVRSNAPGSNASSASSASSASVGVNPLIAPTIGNGPVVSSSSPPGLPALGPTLRIPAPGGSGVTLRTSSAG
jgi:carbon storage regulator